MDKKHFLAYVKWSHVLEWKREEIIQGRLKREEHIKPYAFGTSREFIYNNAKKGDVLWIFTIPMFGMSSSLPSLNAKLVIDEVINREKENKEDVDNKVPKYIRDRWIQGDRNRNWKYVVIGNKDRSYYYPINMAFQVIKVALKKEHRKKVTNEEDKKNNSYLSNYFRTIRLIDNNAENELLDFEKNMKKIKNIFISYRRGRGARLILALIEKITRNNINCWFDINRIPQEKDKRKEFEIFFRNELKSSLDECLIFLVIKRNDYFDSYWTKLEYNLAHNKKKKRQKSNKPLHILEYDLSDIKNEEESNKVLKNICEKYKDVNIE